jgi:hypothetical protein
LDWLYRLFWGIYYLLRRFVHLSNRVLEGPAGIIWALLLLVLVISLITSSELGG